MRSVFKEYKRLKKLAQVTDGQLGIEAMGAFLEKVDDEVLAGLKVSEKDRNKLEKVAPETQMKILSSYLEKVLKQGVEDKINSKIRMSEKIAQIIGRKAVNKSKKIILPHQALLMLARMSPAAMISLENSKKVFIYPLAKIKQILMELDQAEVVWELETNRLKIISIDKKDKCAFLLFPQDPSTVNGRPRFPVKIAPARDLSITELLVRAVEAFMG